MERSLNKMGIIGHIHHGKTTLANKVATQLASENQEPIVVGRGNLDDEMVEKLEEKGIQVVDDIKGTVLDAINHIESTYEFKNYRMSDSYIYDYDDNPYKNKKERGKNNTKHKPRKKKSKSFGKKKK